MTRRSVDIDGISHGALPIPQASRVGPLLVSGGINGVDRATGAFGETIERQIELIFDNIASLVEIAGGSVEDIAKVVFHVRDKSCRQLIDGAWVAMFPNPESRPARHTLVQELNGPMLLQAELIAYIKENA